MRSACLVLIALFTLCGQQAEQKPAVIEGKVVNSVTGEPIRKTDVTLSTSNLPEGFEDMEAQAAKLGIELPDPEKAAGKPGAPKAPKKTYTGTTDANGKFRIEGIDPGDYYLKVKHAGFVDQEYKPSAKDSWEGRLHLTSGRQLSDVEFKLVPHGAISGKVVDEDGDPVTEASVQAVTYSYSSGRRKLAPADFAQVNDRGEFRLSKLPPGRYYVSAGVTPNPMATPPPPKDGQPEIAYVTSYFPRTTDPDQAEVIDIKPAADIPGIVIHMQKGQVVRISGKLAGPDGQPIKSGQLMLMGGGGPMAMHMAMVNNPEGKFEIANLQPGTYMAMVMQMGSGNPSVTMQPLVVPKESVKDLKLGTPPEGSVHGRVVVSGDAAIPKKGLSVMLSAEEAAMPVFGFADDAGAFTLNKVGQAEYTVSLSVMPPGTYVKSVLWNGKEILGQPLNLIGGTSGELQVILATDGGKISASVKRDDKPVSDATVVLLPSNPDRRFPETVKHLESNDAGTVNFQDVPPGDYLTFAWEKVDDGQWFDPAFLKRYENQGVRVTVEPKGSATVDLKPAVEQK